LSARQLIYCTRLMPKNFSEIKVQDIMTTKIQAATPQDSVLDVAKTMLDRDFNGVPIVDRNMKLVGMVTMKELLDKKGLYLPTAVRFLSSLKVMHGKDSPELNRKLQKLRDMKVVQIMNHDPFYILSSIRLEQAAEAFLIHDEELLPVVDEKKNLVGVLAKYDILRSLTTGAERLNRPRQLTIESEETADLPEIEKQFVMVSRTRARFWYVALFFFLVIGFIISVAVILRIRIV